MGLSFFLKLGYGVGHVLNDLCSSIWFTYALIFYNLVIGLTDINAGIVLLVGQIADAVATPAVGYISDRSPGRFARFYGKRKMWHLIGTIGILVSFPFMFSPCLSCEESGTLIKLIYYCSFVIVFQLSWAFVQITHLSLAPDITADPNERTKLLSIRTTFAVLSNITVYSVAWGVIIADAQGSKISSDDILVFQILAYTVCGVGALTTLIFHFLVRETQHDSSDLEPLQTERLPIKTIFARCKLYQVAVLYMSARLFGNMIQSLIPLYVHEVLHLDPQTIAIVPFVMYMSSFITSLFTGPMNKRFGREFAFSFGGIVAVSGVLTILFAYGYLYDNYFIYAVAILLGCAQSTFLVTSLAIITDFIGSDVGNGAFIYGIMSFTDKLSSGAAIMIVQSVARYEAPMFYKYATVIVCGVSAVIGTLAALTLNVNCTKRPDVQDSTEPSPSNTKGN